MKSTEVYKTIHRIVGPWCRQNGFKRAKSGWLAYQKPWGSKQLAFWFQCNKWGWDKYSGSSFTVEFQLHESQELGQLSNRRFQEFLTAEELEYVRARQNKIISRIPSSPRDWTEAFESNARRLYKNSEEIIAGFRMSWAPIEQPYRPNHDIWLRYWQEEDVLAWTIFIASILPRVIKQITTESRTIGCT